MDKDAKELKWYTYKTKCVSWLSIILDSLNCYEMNARTIYNDNSVYNLILCFIIIYENLRNKRKITKNEVDIPVNNV